VGRGWPERVKKTQGKTGSTLNGNKNKKDRGGKDHRPVKRTGKGKEVSRGTVQSQRSVSHGLEGGRYDGLGWGKKKIKRAF